MSNTREHVNAVEMVGRLGQTPELKHTDDGTPYVRLSLATSERYTDRGGEIRERTEWHSGVAWGKTAEGIAQQLGKGDSVALTASLRINSYEKEGVKNRTTELNVIEARKNADRFVSKNEARLVGVVREEPRTREVGEGRALTVVSVATKTAVNGREREDWHIVNLWGRNAEAARELKAGDTVAINGSLRHRTIATEGSPGRKVSAIEAQRFQILERARDLGVEPQVRKSRKGVDRGA
jgi:single-strand DNA-binding protein